MKRHRRSEDPIQPPAGAGLASDGRDLDPRLAHARGLGSGLAAEPSAPDRALPGSGMPVWDRSPSPGGDRLDTYYDQPVVKAPAWSAAVAAYLVTGGVAGTGAALAAIVDVLGSLDQQQVARLARPLAAAASVASAGLLVSDLGRPERFLHMIRVVRPTSVMNVGGYLLASTTGASLAATLLCGRPGMLGRVGRLAAVGAGIAGIPLAGYTGVLLSATALPGWNIGTRTLPPLFLSSGAATSGALLQLAPLGERARRTVNLVTASAQIGELIADAAHERNLATRPRTRAAYEAQWGWRTGRYLTAASLALSLLPARHRAGGRAIAAVLGGTGSILTKTAVFSAGMATAADPRAVSESRRARQHV
jgi:hypothetical protein